MNDDIRVATGWRLHPKRLALRSRLGREGCDCLLDLWIFAALERPNGDLSGLTDRQIEAVAGWEGEAGAMTSALIATRLLDGTAENRKLHDWAEHQPWCTRVRERIRAAKIAASARWNLKHGNTLMRAASTPHDATSEKPHDAPTPTPTPTPTPPPPIPKETEAAPPARPARKRAPRPPREPAPRDGFADHAFRAWEARHGAPPPWGTPEYVALAEIHRRLNGRAAAAWSRYLDCDEPFFDGHSPRKMLSDLGRFCVDQWPPPPPPESPEQQAARLKREAYLAELAEQKRRREAAEERSREEYRRRYFAGPPLPPEFLPPAMRARAENADD